MALDTADKRASSIGVGLGFLRVWPAPDGAALSQADRQHTALSYRGIQATLGITLVGLWSDIHHLYADRRTVRVKAARQTQTVYANRESVKVRS